MGICHQARGQPLVSRMPPEERPEIGNELLSRHLSQFFEPSTVPEDVFWARTVDNDALAVEMEAQVRHLDAQMSVLQSSHAAFVSEVDTLRIKFGTDLVGSVSENIRALRTDVNSLIEFLRGYPDILKGIHSKLNRLLALIKALENTMRDGEAGPCSKSVVSHLIRANDCGKKYPPRENDVNYGFDSSHSSDHSSLSEGSHRFEATHGVIRSCFEGRCPAGFKNVRPPDPLYTDLLS